MTEPGRIPSETSEFPEEPAGSKAMVGAPMRTVVMMKPIRALRLRGEHFRETLEAASETEMLDRLIRILDDPRMTRDHKAAALVSNIQDLAETIVRALEDPEI